MEIAKGPMNFAQTIDLKSSLWLGCHKVSASSMTCLLTGSHFRAIKDMILERLPDHRVIGFFVARRAIPSPFENVSLEELLK